MTERAKVAESILTRILKDVQAGKITNETQEYLAVWKRSHTMWLVANEE